MCGNEMDMLRWMCNMNMKDRIRSKDIRSKISLTCIEQKNERVPSKVIWSYSTETFECTNKQSRDDEVREVEQDLFKRLIHVIAKEYKPQGPK